MSQRFYKEFLDSAIINSVNCRKVRACKRYEDLIKEDCTIEAYFDGHCTNKKCNDYIDKKQNY